MNENNRGFDRKKIKQIKEVIIFSAIVVLLVYYSGKIGDLALLVLGIMMPFIIGAAIAFIINLPMNAIEKKILGKWNGKAAKKLKRPISLVGAILFVIAIVALVIGTVVPQLVATIGDIIDVIPSAFDRFINWLQKLFKDNPKIMEYINKIDTDSINIEGMVTSAIDIAKNQIVNVLSGAAGLISGIAGGVVDAVISVIFAVYILVSKEKLANQAERIARAYLKEKHYRWVIKTGKLLNKNFNNFISGQCLEAIILGLMFFVTMSIAGIPYPALAGVLIGFTALIPVAGAFIGCIITAFLILMVSPIKMVIFVVMFLILQQIEGNLIYPKVVGNSVGLPAIWVLMAVTVGGSLMGVVGMLIFIPIFSTIYMLFRDDVNYRNGIKRRNAMRGQAKKKKLLMEEMGINESVNTTILEAVEVMEVEVIGNNEVVTDNSIEAEEVNTTSN